MEEIYQKENVRANRQIGREQKNKIKGLSRKCNNQIIKLPRIENRGKEDKEFLMKQFRHTIQN